MPRLQVGSHGSAGLQSCRLCAFVPDTEDPLVGSVMGTAYGGWFYRSHKSADDLGIVYRFTTSTGYFLLEFEAINKWRAICLGTYCFPFFNSCIRVSLLLCFLLFCFSLLFCFDVSLLLCFSASSLLEPKQPSNQPERSQKQPDLSINIYIYIIYMI